MAGWESLRVDLRRLHEEAPEALVVLPDPDSERRERPIRIDLAAWATDIAAELKAEYGDLVELRVGAMTFPAKQLWVNEYSRQLRGAPAERAGLDVRAATPLSVRTGRSPRKDVLVTNRTDHEQVLLTMGELGSRVTDGSGNVVGMFVGPQPLPRVGFRLGLMGAGLCLC
ncbi:hypothetical protein [Kribbella jiaozuonensis]|uniref:Uncharacterized protein n=1 Tax=Kribbella jiaozuonensis TaxID=2575441 RepID=A0A4U3LU01_9ACTN|nr:hypothetical protein [Kribbella jiaozuonensis]TKK79531.1 hypothetical protein FDA38_14105 [Kribbella jiaozuonensis]